MKNWQHIETAPKDGSAIIVWNGITVMESAYISEEDDFGDFGWCCGSFTEGGNLSVSNNVIHPPPTHWMPLPEPPK